MIATLGTLIARGRISGFTRHVATMSLGSFGGQGIAYCCTPLLTRFYTPLEMGAAAVIVTVANILGQAATGKYDMAICLPERDDEAWSVFVISLLASFTSLILLLMVWLTSAAQIADLFGIHHAAPWLGFVPLIVFLMGCQQSVQMLLSRRQAWGRVSASLGFQAVGTAGGRLGFGVVGWGTTGMLLGTLCGLLVANATMVGCALRNDWRAAWASLHDWKRMRGLAAKYAEFPRWFCLTSIVNGLGSAIPLFVINKVYGGEEAGRFNLAYLVVGVPASVVASAVAQVFQQRIADQGRANLPVKPLVWALATRLACLALPALVVLLAFGPELFRVAFGEKWELAGHYARVTGVAYAVQFVISPLSMVFHVVGAVKLSSLWKVAFFCTSLATALAASRLPINSFLLAYAIHDVVLYSAYGWLAVSCVVRTRGRSLDRKK